MPGWTAIFGFLNRAWDALKIFGAFLAGAAYQRRKQDEAADEEIQDARIERDEARDISEDDIDDFLSGRR